MSSESLHDKLSALLDRDAIVDVACKFAVSIDRRRWDDLASCFADVVDINTIRTGRWVRFARDELVEVLRPAFESYTATQHISANHQVTIDGDTATVWSTLNATHYVRGSAGGEYQQQVGYYEYQLVRDGGWRICGAEQVAHWQRGNQAIFDGTIR